MSSDLDKAQRFISKAVSIGECLECHVKPRQDGYCQTTNGEMVHRLVYRELVGPIGDYKVLHKCDNRCCINPKHLFLGTQLDNMQDMVAKGRKADTTGQTRAVTLATAQLIYDTFMKGGITKAELGRRHNVSIMTISNIIFGTVGYADVDRS